MNEFSVWGELPLYGTILWISSKSQNTFDWMFERWAHFYRYTLYGMYCNNLLFWGTQTQRADAGEWCRVFRALSGGLISRAGPVCQSNEVKVKGHPGSTLHHLRGPKRGSGPTCKWLAAKPKENTCWWAWGAGTPCPHRCFYSTMERDGKFKDKRNKTILKIRLLIELRTVNALAVFWSLASSACTGAVFWICVLIELKP